MSRLAFRSNRQLQGMIGWVALLWIVTAIKPLYPQDWLLENLLVFIWCGILAGTYRRFAFSNLSYALFTLFISMHLVGAHYTYAETPLGFWLQEIFGFQRNHYDRIVHFSFGLLIAYPFREILLRCSGLTVGWSYFMATTSILAFSAFYELLESMAAEVVSPELGMAYLGTQGDVWDAQKDTFLAYLGSFAAMGVTWLAVRRQAAA